MLCEMNCWLDSLKIEMKIKMYNHVALRMNVVTIKMKDADVEIDTEMWRTQRHKKKKYIYESNVMNLLKYEVMFPWSLLIWKLNKVKSKSY